MGRSRADFFLAGLEGKVDDVDRDILEERLAGIVDRAQARWPGISVPVDEFLAHLGRHLPDGAGVLEALQKIRTDDLYLALACAEGDSKAVEAFRQLVAGGVHGAIRRAGVRQDDLDDVLQQIWEIILVPRADLPPRIIGYSGRAQLRNWAGVIAARESRRLLKKSGRESPRDPDLFDVWPTGENEEIEVIKKSYRSQFKQAFEEALETLSPRDRNLLRLHLFEDLSVPQLGALYKVHRYTALRWMTAVRQKLLEATREILAARLNVPGQQVESILGFIGSRLEASIQRVLDDPSTAQKDPRK